MSRFKSLVEFAIVVIIISLSFHPTHSFASSSKVLPNNFEVDQTLSKMTLDQKVGQLFLFGFYGTEMSEELRQTITNYHPGGIIFFSRNIVSASQVGKLNYELQHLSLSQSKIPLFTAVDQEGGSVTRIKNSPPLPSALAVGKTQSTELSKKIGFFSGKILNSLGFNLNLAPVLDVSNPNAESFIGTRSFSEDPNSVSQLTAAYTEGLMDAGVLPTLKHFPGHGNEKVDPHSETPRVSSQLPELFSSSLKPYQYLISHLQIPLVMVAHVAVPNVDPNASVATYSKILLEDILRKKLLYKGLILTDDIDMAAAKLVGGPSEQAVQALQAGVDIIMVAWNHKTQRAAFNGIKNALKKGTLNIKRVDESVRRIIAIKKQYGFFDQKAFSVRKIQVALRDPNYAAAVKKVFKTNFIAGTDRKMASVQTKKALVFSKSHDFLKSFAKRTPHACCRAFSLTATSDLGQVLDQNKSALAVVHVSGSQSARLMNSVPIRARNRIILVNTNSPSLILSPENYFRVINLYSYYPDAGSLIADYIFSSYVIGSFHKPTDLTLSSE